MRLIGPSDMLSVAASVRSGVTSAIDEFATFVELINRGGALMDQAQAVLDQAQLVLARANAAVADSEVAIKGVSATVSEAAAASLLASKALHDSEELLRRAELVVASMEASQKRPPGSSVGWPSDPPPAPAVTPAPAKSRTANRSSSGSRRAKPAKKAAAPVTPSPEAAVETSDPISGLQEAPAEGSGTSSA